MEKKHSPLPWSLGCDETIKIRHGFDNSIAGIMFTNTEREKLPAEANAAFIVKACNSHYELVEALKSISKNTCCDTCQEAKLVAKAALKKAGEL